VTSKVELEAAQELALRLMREHGFGGSGWTVGFDYAKRRFGYCSYTDKRISLSSYLVEMNDEAQVRDTILHEIAHALTPGAKHGWRWKQKCVEIGADPTRCFDDDQVNMPDVAKRLKRWEATCEHCGLVHYRARLPKSGGLPTTSSCAQCSPGRYNENFVLTWKDTYDQRKG
jgi:predicted SprT family Zn-dependent metalloprotease